MIPEDNILDAEFETIDCVTDKVNTESPKSEPKTQKNLPSPPIENSDDFQANLEDLISLMKWVNGESDKLTVRTETVIANLTKKLSTVTSYAITSNLKRVSKLLNFIKTVEDDMFDEERIGVMDPKEKTYFYMLAKNALNEVLDVSRKYMIQNKENMPDYQSDDSAKRVLDQLKALPKDKLEELLTKLEKNEI